MGREITKVRFGTNPTNRPTVGREIPIEQFAPVQLKSVDGGPSNANRAICYHFEPKLATLVQETPTKPFGASPPPITLC